MPLLDVKDLRVTFEVNDGTVSAVNGVTFSMEPGETLGIVGESGSGKSQTAFALLGLLARNGRASGEASFDGQPLIGLSEAQLNAIRADKISMIFQDPMTALNPYMRVSDQMCEVLQLHKGSSRHDAEAEAARMLDAVRIPDARARLTMFPHEFSGGMRQRVMIAMALLCRPRLLIADEPTTALDVTVQDQIMDLLKDVRREFGTAIILITHDLGIVAGSCDRILVMYGGQLMETAETLALFDRPTHPYTQGLLSAVPRLDAHVDVLPTIDGEPPNMLALPQGCPFAPRCDYARPICSETMPALERDTAGHARRCHVPIPEVAA